MRLFINNPSHENLDKFIYEYIFPEIQLIFTYNLNISRCTNWTKYFHKIDLGWITYKNHKTIIPSAYEILLAGLKNLRVLNCHNHYIIEINPNEIAPKTRAKLIDICNLINYGNLEMPGYPIFENTFNEVLIHLPDLYKQYLED